MCLRFRFCIHQRVWVLHVLRKCQTNSLFPSVYSWDIDITLILMRLCAGSIGEVDGGSKKVTQRRRNYDDRNEPREGRDVRTHIHCKWSKTLFLCPPMLTNIAGQSSQSGTGMNKKIPMPEPVRYRNKATQSGTGILRYRTEIQDAGMPMPSYAYKV